MTRRILTLLSILMVVATAATGCSSSSSKTIASTGAVSGNSSVGVLPVAAQRVAAFTAHSAPLPVTDAVAVPSAKQTFVFIQCLQVICKQVGDALQVVADDIGAKLIRLAVQDTPETVQQAAITALQDKPTAVFDGAEPTEWFAAQLATMKAQNIPLVAWSLPGGLTTAGVSANLLPSDEYTLNGTLMADWVASKSGPGSHSLLLNVPSYPVLAALAKGYTTEMAKVCPTCKVVTAPFTVTDLINGAVPAAAVAALQRDPKITYIAGAFGGLISAQLSQAVKAAGFSKVRAISQAGTSANFQLIQKGDFEVADLSVNAGFLAWRGVDVVFRVLASKSVQATSSSIPALATIDGAPDTLTSGVPEEFITKEQVGTGQITDDAFDQLWSPTTGYQAAFKKLWGLN